MDPSEKITTNIQKNVDYRDTDSRYRDTDSRYRKFQVKKYEKFASIRLLESVFRIRIIWSDPDPDPYQEALIWIRVAPKINQNHGINKLKWFVNVLFT